MTLCTDLAEAAHEMIMFNIIQNAGSYSIIHNDNNRISSQLPSLSSIGGIVVAAGSGSIVLRMCSIIKCTSRTLPSLTQTFLHPDNISVSLPSHLSNSNQEDNRRLRSDRGQVLRPNPSYPSTRLYRCVEVSQRSRVKSAGRREFGG